MKILILFFLVTATLQAQHQDFINRFYQVAMTENRLYGIPASVTLAQAILETGGGTSLGFKDHKNSFGIRCTKKKHINCCAPYVDAGDKIRLRKYNTCWESFRCHSKYITSGKYADMYGTCGLDPYKWCDELQKRGYSSNKQYSKRLKKLIQQYDLTIYDQSYL